MKTIFFLPLLSATAALHAQDTFTIDWACISGGGGLPSGEGEFSVAGSIGQFAAGAPGSGDAAEISLTAGYWTLEETPMELGLTMQRSGSSVTLTWDGTRGIPVVLESSTDLQLWVPVSPQPAGPPFTESIFARRCYRLRRVP